MFPLFIVFKTIVFSVNVLYLLHFFGFSKNLFHDETPELKKGRKKNTHTTVTINVIIREKITRLWGSSNIKGV